MTETALIMVQDIEVGERFRKDLGDISELAESIRDKGLLQPIVVKRQQGEKPFLLMAGGRRLTAIKHLRESEVLAHIFDRELSELEIRDIELTENLLRKDLTWQEQVKLQEEIHQLRINLHGMSSTSQKSEGWNIEKTAALVKSNRSSVSVNLRLAEELKNDPNKYEGCKTISEATKILKKKDEQTATRIVATIKEKHIKASPSTKQSLIDSFIIGDALEGMKKLKSETFNFVEIDPPYGIELKERKGLTTVDQYNEVEASEYINFMTIVLEEAYRVMLPHSWIILWYGTGDWHTEMFNLLKTVGFKVGKLPAIWVKPNGQNKQPATSLTNCYETFFYARKGEPKLNRQGRLNVFDYQPVPVNNKIHPTERPLPMMEEIMNTFCAPNGKVLVPFLGSGTSLIAAFNTERSALGFELGKQYKDSFIIKVSNMV